MNRFAAGAGALAATAALLAGCATSRLAQLPADNCLKGNSNRSNTIEVYLDDTTRRPIAVPEVCHVKAGSQIVWVQRKDPSKRVLIEFDKGCGSPERRGNGNFPGTLDLSKNEHYATLGQTRDYSPTGGCEIPNSRERQYRYSVSIGGLKSDPSIIIDM